LYDGSVVPQPITPDTVGEFLRCSMGLSAWKQYGQSRWALRVNPSSGNLHPTEAWIVRDGRVCHYAPREHALEERCVFDARNGSEPASDSFVVALTSIVWREAWKYGERAFRYCQHDVGHAIGALRLAAALLGWRMQLLSGWSDTQIAALLGLDRDSDFEGAEREEPECIALVSRNELGRGIGNGALSPGELLPRVREGRWYGRANQLSRAHIDWPAIDEVVAATRFPGNDSHESPAPVIETSNVIAAAGADMSARRMILQRRSALSFDPRGHLTREGFTKILDRLRPTGPPWDVIDWPPHVHLVLFVHRVQGLAPGVYALLRDPAVLDEWKAAMRPEFLWERATLPTETPDLFLLLPIDAAHIAKRLSCDQDIASDGYFSVSMLARFESALHTRGEWFYRRLFWESGLIGQVLYLDAEAAGARSTGIGCYYDEPVHDLLGLSGHEWQSLYHFSMGLPIDDERLTTETGYSWEG